MALGFTHESTHNESKEWYTPPHIFNALGVEFDLDPCYPPQEVKHIPARNKFTIFDNGLIKKWDGLVWMNPPYGADTPRWMARLAEHNNGIALVFSRTDTEWFHQYTLGASVVCFIRGRIKFLKPSGISGGSPGSGSMLIGFGETASKILVESKLGLCMKCLSGFGGL